MDADMKNNTVDGVPAKISVDPSLPDFNPFLGGPGMLQVCYDGGKLVEVNVRQDDFEANIGKNSVRLLDKVNGNVICVPAETIVVIAMHWQRLWGEKFAPYSPPGEDNRYPEECVGL